jgi:hypothetical protein
MEDSKQYFREAQRRWAAVPANHAKILARLAKWRAEHPERAAEISANTRRKLKREVLAHYGPNGEARCSWPGCEWTDLEALSIDHVNGGGNEERRKLGRKAGQHFYYWLKQNGYPEGYQTLCMNHQFVKRVVERECKRKGESL